MPSLSRNPNSSSSEAADGQVALALSATLPIALLSSGNHLRVSSNSGVDALCLSSSAGKLRLRVTIDGDALMIESFDGRNVLSINGPLVLQADSVELSAKQHLAISSGGAVSIQASGPVTIGAASIDLTAHRGDVAINANDDVRMEAERIRMNA